MSKDTYIEPRDTVHIFVLKIRRLSLEIHIFVLKIRILSLEIHIFVKRYIY